MKSLFRYEQKDSLLHRLDPRVKLFWLFGISVLSVVFGTPDLLAILFISTLPFWFMLKPSKGRIKAIIIIFMSVLLSFTISQALFYYWAEDPLFTLVPSSFPLLGPLTGGIYFYADGAVYGLYQSFRVMASLSAAMLVIATTHPGMLIDAFVRFFEIRIAGKSYRIGIPYEIAFMVSSAVSFAPTMLEESGIILNAMQARGLELKGDIRRKAKALKYILVPLVVNILRAGRKLAIAADTRGFRANRHRTYVNELKLKRNDYIFLIYTILLTSGGLYLSYIGFGGTVPV
ncbi:energy-coupling factor transporter transmembrane component T [Methanosarcina sp.]|uniref:energy-coupling factor transporter transmembrane component T family protein n=1 Tax=Methanosarcina sp. TaxID=2213 RepID=UPI00298815BC|nr:energy-coupling factor transporter transmembrane component T [Methanosarcina sp.]MDW5549783.1 energy-coupling factor transporter transmembrane component T [Methanosarcina sp.]MDW5554866.1 energy-coupling factor transporter transmembrane component T [Methanosarcina sp.]MDW5557996.1 energy-coupling factor transporter transmembrane component T [Methanosarcina sp.]